MNTEKYQACITRAARALIAHMDDEAAAAMREACARTGGDPQIAQMGVRDAVVERVAELAGSSSTETVRRIDEAVRAQTKK
jgi:hypothetical protein